MTTITFQPYAPGTTSSEGNRLGSIDPRLSRTNYFDGQLLRASDLTRDQIYLDERLLEMGQILGSGIARGLDLGLVDHHILRLQPGIAVAPSGRVLQLSSKTLEINLQDSGLIADLNNGLYRRFNRGLYAVVLRYAEVVDDVAEAYPADLASRRRMQVSSYAEGVELALIPLNLTLPRGDALAIRASLAQQLISHAGLLSLPSDEAVALGLIAIDNGRPLWLDHGLLRRPLRRPNLGNALQLDLAAHYQELFAEVQASRQQSGRQDDFAASSYFRLLPPFGPLPKGAIDPVNGRQSYFPRDYEVAIAPVRRADLPAIIEESAHLAPLDLERDADADIMVLVPLSDQAFALRARQLERTPQPPTTVLNTLPFFNSLALRLFAQPPAHRLDTDVEAWKGIWQEADELIYVRRPPRTAETNVSAVVLARGFALPAPGTELPPDFADLEAQLDQALEEGDAAKTALAQNEAQLAALRAQVTQLEQMLGSNAALNEVLAQAQALQAQLAAAEEEIARLRQSSQDAAVFKTALEATTVRLAAVSTELELAHQRIAELQGSGVIPDTATQQKLKELTEALAEANGKAVQLTAERDALQVKLAELELKANSLAAELQAAQKKLDALSGSAGSSDADLAAAKEEISKLSVELEGLVQEKHTLEANLLKAQQAQAAAEIESKNATHQLSTALTQLQSAQADLNACRLQLDTLTKQNATLQAQVDSGEATISELKQQLAQRVLLDRTFPFGDLAKLRGSSSTAPEKLDALVATNTSARVAAIHLLLVTPVIYDKALWPSLISVTQESLKNLQRLRDLVALSLSQGMAVGEAYITHGQQLGMTADDVRNWKMLSG